MQRIKEIKRVGILETNSSSSHSLCISTDGSLCRPGDKCWDIELSEDGKTAYLPKFQTCFNQQNFRTNHCSTKAQYAYAAALHKNPRKQLEITELIKRVTGAENVVIGWVEAYKEEISKVGHNLSRAEFHVPSIDHDSIDDAFIQIFESEETLKNFIFNPCSWLVVELDAYYSNIDIDKVSIRCKDIQNLGYFDDVDTGILSIDIGGAFGRIDLEVEGYSDIILSEILQNEKISGLSLDKNLSPLYCDQYISSYPPMIVYKDDGPYLVLFESHTVKDGEKIAARFSTTEITTYDTFISADIVEQYKMYKINLTSDKYGKIV